MFLLLQCMGGQATKSVAGKHCQGTPSCQISTGILILLQLAASSCDSYPKEGFLQCFSTGCRETKNILCLKLVLLKPETIKWILLKRVSQVLVQLLNSPVAVHSYPILGDFVRRVKVWRIMKEIFQSSASFSLLIAGWVLGKQRLHFFFSVSKL